MMEAIQVYKICVYVAFFSVIIFNQILRLDFFLLLLLLLLKIFIEFSFSAKADINHNIE